MLKYILIANRGEVALRVAQAAADLGAGSVAVVAQDDPQQAHTRAASRHAVLPGQGPAAYLDLGALLDVARRTGCDAVHPGYGFLSERPDFAQACADAGYAVKVKVTTIRPGITISMVEDPDGNWVEFLQAG